MKQVNANMTHAEALDMLAALDARRWGEQERDQSRVINMGKSRGQLLSAIIYHYENALGENFSAEFRAEIERELTADDRAALRDS